LPEILVGTVPTVTVQHPKPDLSGSMQVLAWYGKKDVRLVERHRPAITEPTDAIIKITTTTICGSDLHLYNNEIPEMKTGDILGHEAVGVVWDIGSEVTSLKKGQRVVISAIIAEGHCDYCERQEYSLCDKTNPSGVLEKSYGHRTAGIFGYSHLLGGYDGLQADYARVPFADLNCLPIPDNVSDEQAIMLSDIACTGFHATELGSVSEGQTVCVWGAGPVGLMAAAWAKFRGASPIFIVDSVPERLHLAAQKIGAIPINFKKENVLERLRELAPNGPDVAIDATGFDYAKSWTHTIQRKLYLETDAIDAVHEAIMAVRKGGVVSVVGDYVGFCNGFPIGAFMEKGLTMRGGQVFVQRYWKDLMGLIQNGKFDPTFVISHRLPLDQGPSAYSIFDKKQDGAVKILLATQTAKEE
jgi:threonine dehydrogenase-like Zn-dependent dehydrogenase